MSPILALTVNRGQTIGFAVLTLVFLAAAIATIRLRRPRSVIVSAFLAVVMGAAVTWASANGVVFAPR